MPEHLRALIVILILVSTCFVIARQSACTIIRGEDFTRRRNIWFALTLAVFLSHSFWIYLILAILLLLYVKRSEPNPPALFFFLLFVMPVALIPIPGFGAISFLFDLSHPRILAFLILLPAYFSLRKQSNTLAFGRTGADKALAAYLLLTAILYFRQDSVTNSLRQSFYLFIDVYLPYFVISRSMRDLQIFRDTMMSLVLAIMILAPIAVFEAYRGWLLYQPLLEALNLGQEAMMIYTGRDGILRAIASTGQPIALGFLMVVGIGTFLYIHRSIQQKFIRQLGMILLFMGLIAPLSRGPWIGAAVMLVVFIATGRYAIPRLMSLGLGAMLILPLISTIPGGERIINLLPFIGTTEKKNIDYREQLITNSMIVIQRNPLFGSIDYIKTPEMEAMRQGGGIIDIVNTYIEVALEAGWVGVGLFVSFFIITLISIYRAMRSISDKKGEEYLLGRALLSTLLSMLVIIFTVSSITIIPIMYWSIAALGVAYAQMVRKHALSIAAPTSPNSR